MCSARSALILVLAIALAAFRPPAAAEGVEDPRIAGEILKLFVCWDADAETPKVVRGEGCAVAGMADAPTDPPENEAFARLAHAIKQLQADIDAFRLTTESPDPAPLHWEINAAGPNHLYYAAHSLLRNANGAGGDTHGTCAPQKNAATLDVVVEAVVCVNHELRRRLGIAAAANAASGTPWRAAGESALQVAARLLERLMATGHALPVETTPSAIYDRLEDAARNLAGLRGGSFAALPAPSQRAKNAADVYSLVFRCLRLSQVLEVKRNLETRQRGTLALSQWHGVDVAPNSPSLQINPAENAGSAGVELAHVYDLATLVAAQLGTIGDGGSAEAVYARPPEATLSDVFGLASALEAQLMKMTGITGRR